MRKIIFGLLLSACIYAQDTVKVINKRTIDLYDTTLVIKIPADTTAIIEKYKKEYDKNVTEMLFYINEAITEYLKRKSN